MVLVILCLGFVDERGCWAGLPRRLWLTMVMMVVVMVILMAVRDAVFLRAPMLAHRLPRA